MVKPAEQRDYRTEDTGAFVVVTIAPGGIVHVWGNGPVVDTDDQVVPFRYRADARRLADQLVRDDRAQHPEADPLTVKVSKLLGAQRSEVKVEV